MNAYDLLDALGSVDDGCVTAAIAGSNRRTGALWLKWGAVAASACLIVTGVTAAWLHIQQHSATVGIPETGTALGGIETYVETDSDGKRSIYDIRHATVVDMTEAVAVSDDADGDIYMPEEYAYILKNQNHSSTVIGEAQNIRSISVSDGDYTWYITTFDISVREMIKHPEDTEMMRCITAVKCFRDGSPTVDCGISDVGMEIVKDPNGLFVARPVGDDTWKINFATYALADYADYYVSCKYDCTTDSFTYFGSEIPLEDIRP